MSIPIEIYLEQTPNPDSMKFLVNKVLLPNMVFDSKRTQPSEGSPLADSLYEKYEWIGGVFITNNFITISKNTQNDWYEYMHEVKEYLKMYIQNNFDLVEKSFLEAQMADKQSDTIDDSVEGRIKDLLEKYVKPAVESDGGLIEFKSFDNGKVTLAMKGSCSGCPSSQVTLKSGIEGLLKRMVPEVEEVVAAAE